MLFCVRVGLANIEKRSADLCDAIFGDNLARAVTWRGDEALHASPGDSVVLQFRMRAAELFGFEWV